MLSTPSAFAVLRFFVALMTRLAESKVTIKALDKFLDASKLKISFVFPLEASESTSINFPANCLSTKTDLRALSTTFLLTFCLDQIQSPHLALKEIE